MIPMIYGTGHGTGNRSMSMQNLDNDLLNQLNDDKICNIFLYGDLHLSDNENHILFDMALTFIQATKRFDQRIVH